MFVSFLSLLLLLSSCHLSSFCRCRQQHKGLMVILIQAAGCTQLLHQNTSVLTDLAHLQSGCHLSCCNSCRQRHRGPVVIVTQAAGGAQRLHHDMPGLADFPCCDIPARAADSKYPPLQWQQRAAKVAVHRVAAHCSWLQVGIVQEPGTTPVMSLG